MMALFLNNHWLDMIKTSRIDQHYYYLFCNKFSNWILEKNECICMIMKNLHITDELFV